MTSNKSIFDIMFATKTHEHIDFLGDGIFAIYQPHFNNDVKATLSNAMFKAKDVLTDLPNEMLELFQTCEKTGHAKLFNVIDDFNKGLENDIPPSKLETEIQTFLDSTLLSLEMLIFPNPIWEKEHNDDYCFINENNNCYKLTFVFNIFDESQDRVLLDKENTKYIPAKE